MHFSFPLIDNYVVQPNSSLSPIVSLGFVIEDRGLLRDADAFFESFFVALKKMLYICKLQIMVASLFVREA